MDGRVVGLLVAGGMPPLAGLGFAEDPALTPFAGKYRFFDLALAALANSGVTSIHVAAPRPSAALRAHVLASTRLRRELRRPLLHAAPKDRTGYTGRLSRFASSLAAYRETIRTSEPGLIVALTTDHILQVDVRELARASRTNHAVVTLLAVPRPVDESGAGLILRLGPDGSVEGVGTPPGTPRDGCGLALSWSGDMMVSGAALAQVVPLLTRVAPLGDERALAALCAHVRVAALDVFDGCFPRATPYWHEPSSIESYYDAQMNLCTNRPLLDLFNPAWPLSPVPSGLGPAKVVADAAGHPGQVLNALVSDGAVVRGGAIRNAVLGYDVTVEVGAEVEDSILLDGCRIGRHARVRRAIVGPGAVVGDEEQIGYDALPPGSARLLPSGLTLVPPLAPLVAAAGAR